MLVQTYGILELNNGFDLIKLIETPLHNISVFKLIVLRTRPLR